MSMKKKLSFQVKKTSWHARVWQIELNGVTLSTPAFMPVWTNATIKWIPLERLNTWYLWSQNNIRLILNNTFHLYLRPGAEIIHKVWWMHKFQHRDGLILTDSGWFQIYSLGLWKKWWWIVKIKDDGAYFSSPHDGSKHVFTPTGVVDIQRTLWSDIMMMLDVCAPIQDITKKEVANYMYLTHRRAKQQFDYHMQDYERYKGVLFPIIQWWIYHDLREESAEVLSKYEFDGIAIWWLSVWESKEQMYTTLDWLVDKLPHDIPRYLMWVWTPEDLIEAVDRWIDMFDCVMPTRLGRHGTAFTPTWNIKLKNSRFKDDITWLTATCPCYTCKTFSKAYLHHLIKSKEMLWWMLLSLHNIAYLHHILELKKQEILAI